MKNVELEQKIIILIQMNEPLELILDIYEKIDIEIGLVMIEKKKLMNGKNL
jgi:hypothetical protein